MASNAFKPPMASVVVRSKAVVLFFVVLCFVLLPLVCWGFVLGTCFVVQYFMVFKVL